LKHALIFLCAAILLNLGEARAQQPGQAKSGPREQAQPAGPRGAPRAMREGRGLAADNLERVAAAAEQILEILNRDAGLMVVFKRMIAQDASAIGQLLEESDLTDSALTARLNEDLRTRVLATRLLQKYGYLLPKINPESELGQEQKLVLQERAQQLVRASERSRADIVWVGLSAPKQDRWMFVHRERLSVPVLIGVGAAFDFHTRRVPRAPVWLRENGFEWLFRLLIEPRRMWKRYLVYGSQFVILVALELLGLKKFS
jgi:hypothetical protein